MKKLRSQRQGFLIKGLSWAIPEKWLSALQRRYIYAPAIANWPKRPLFSAVCFEVRTRCNGHCSFCMASVENDPRADIKMSADLHEKVLEELRDLGFSGRIAYHNNSEPLVFSELVNFVRKARNILPSNHIQILTNGKLLTEKKATDLIEAGISELTVNYYCKTGEEPFPESYQIIAAEVIPRYFQEDEFSIMGLGKMDTKMSSKRMKFRFRVDRRYVNEVLDNRAGSAPNKPQPVQKPRGFCSYPFSHLVVSADGRVPQCCNDVLIENVMGDASTQKVAEIWVGEKFEGVRKPLLRNNRQTNNKCACCDYYGVKIGNTAIEKVIYALTL